MADQSKLAHPLLERELRLISSWKEWREIWSQVVYAESLLGLLQVGFHIRHLEETEWAERICFYLSVADGHTEKLRRPGEREKELYNTAFGGRVTWGEVRQQIAQQAFRELCRHLFKNEAKPEDLPSWLFNLTRDNGKALDAVLTFFLPTDTFAPKLRNLPARRDSGIQDYEIATIFLLGISQFAWDFPCLRENRLDAVKAKRDVFRQHRPQLIQVLAGLERLDVLDEHLLSLDHFCLETLQQIALSTELYLVSPPDWQTKHWRLPTTLEEAATGGSQAAWAILRYKLLRQEADRLTSLRELAAQKQTTTSEPQALEAGTSPAEPAAG